MSFKDCNANHRLCGICGKKMQFNEYFGYIDYDTDYSWDIYHIQLISSNGDIYEVKNLQAAHPWCIKKKKKILGLSLFLF